MAKLIYSLCALTSFMCAWLLLRSYLCTKSRLLFWSALCFAGLTVNNVLLVLDRIVFPISPDLSSWRLAVALIALLLLLYGLINEEK
jgi:hypothetical protein